MSCRVIKVPCDAPGPGVRARDHSQERAGWGEATRRRRGSLAERQHPAVSRAWLEPAGKAARFSDVVHGTRQGAWVSCAETPRDTCSDGEGHPETQRRRSTWPQVPAAARAHRRPRPFFSPPGYGVFSVHPRGERQKTCIEDRVRGTGSRTQPHPSAQGRLPP